MGRSQSVEVSFTIHLTASDRTISDELPQRMRRAPQVCNMPNLRRIRSCPPMDIAMLVRIRRRWWWLAVSAASLGSAAAFLVSTRITPSYEARTTLLVVQRQNEGVVQLNDLQTAERLANTLSRLVTLRSVFDRSIQDGSLPFDAIKLEKRIEVTNPRGTQLLEVTAHASNPELAADAGGSGGSASRPVRSRGRDSSRCRLSSSRACASRRVRDRESGSDAVGSGA
ncbi:MAG: hypothetical protein EXR68_04680 [Dehalococcoidia bacterium]|nr:hypothetical protein [Dehalococcoidia bacterium]